MRDNIDSYLFHMEQWMTGDLRVTPRGCLCGGSLGVARAAYLP